MRVLLGSFLTLQLLAGCGDDSNDKSSDSGSEAMEGFDGSTDVDGSPDADGSTDADSSTDADNPDDTSSDTDSGPADDTADPPDDTAVPHIDTATPDTAGDDAPSGDTAEDTAVADTAAMDTGSTDPDLTVDMDEDGWTVADGDCRDFDSSIHPARPEVCDGIDNNCNGEVDEGVTPTWYLDFDGDGHGTEAFTYDGCMPLTGYVATSDDCNDSNPRAYPDAVEICDEMDNNCNDEVDEDVTTVYYLDEDGDGFGDAGFSTEACLTPSGYTDNADDCNDLNDAVYPGRSEVCDSVDNDCDDAVDEPDASDASIFFEDGDEDGYGDPLSTTLACTAPEGYTADSRDCDDNDDDIHPDAVEVCDDEDNDCNGTIDDEDAVGSFIFHPDADEDGHGDAFSSIAACSMPAGHTTDASDCNDADPLIHPGAVEICNGVDDNCNGDTDDADADLYTETTWYTDADDDGFGDPDAPIRACTVSPDWVEDSSDCDDTNPSINPTGIEVDGDGVDNDCANDPPYINSVTILPTGAGSDDTLTLEIDAGDPDGDALSYLVRWAVSGTLLDADTLELDASYFTRGQFVSVLVTPTDGEASGPPAEASVAIGNGPPSAPSVSIAPADLPVPGEDDLRCTVDVPSTDPDGDSVGYDISWLRDGAPFSGTTSTTVLAGDTIPTSALGGSETWTCVVTPYDETESGTPGEASVFTDASVLHRHDNGLGVIWYNDVPTGTMTSDQAKRSCEQTYGTCYLSTGDCAGHGWCEASETTGAKCWGWTSGCTGGAGRVWRYSSSDTVYGYWD